MCSVSGVKGLNLYTMPLNKRWVYLCLVRQSTCAQSKNNIQNEFRKRIDTQRQIFSWCKLKFQSRETCWFVPNEDTGVQENEQNGDWLLILAHGL